MEATATFHGDYSTFWDLLSHYLLSSENSFFSKVILFHESSKSCHGDTLTVRKMINTVNMQYVIVQMSK